VEQHDCDHGDGTHALDVGSELGVGDGVELVAYGAPPGDIGRYPVA
jgi:hypothetical protein